MSAAPQPSEIRFDLELGSRESDLRDAYRTHFQRIQRDFEKAASGPACIADRSRLVERILVDLWKQAGDGRSGALVAIGGFGRAELFPHSDLDLLFLYPSRDGARCRQECGSRHVSDTVGCRLARQSGGSYPGGVRRYRPEQS